MTVSQVFINGKVMDASINYEIYKRMLETAKPKGEAAVLSVKNPQYETDNADFKTLIISIALSTSSFFAFEPSSDQYRQLVAKEQKKDAKKLPKEVDKEKNPELWQQYEDAKKKLVDQENAKPYIKRNVEGDASETGLLKFIQPLLMDGDYGLYQIGGLEGVRKTYPIVKGVDNDLAVIPFSSDIKFNLIIRDMK